MQEGFLRAPALDRFDPGADFRTRCLNRIVANAALDLARRRKVRNAEELSRVDSGCVSRSGGGWRAERTARGRVGAASGSCAVGDCAAFDVEGYTHAEIGEGMLRHPEAERSLGPAPRAALSAYAGCWET